MKDATFSSARLLSLYDRISDAPDAIPRLRRFVLDLAVRGKLVDQDAADEPAADLLKRIAKEKARLRTSGEKRKETELKQFSTVDAPFPLPHGWIWVRLGDLGETNIGLTYSPSDVSNSGTPVLRSSNVQNGKLDFKDLVRVKCSPKESAMVQDGDLLICARNGSRALVGKVALIENLSERSAFGAFMAIFRSEVNKYLYLFISSPLFRQVIDEVNTTTINQITQNNLRSTLAPIPPLAEQHRIVAKVNELMALCDQLEQARAGREAVRDRLTTASLARLTAPDTDAGTFQSHARFALQSLSTLTTRPDQIKTLRQTILNLAVHGKLLAQDGTDEPVADTLDRISAERNELVRQKAIRREQPLAVIAPKELPYDLPEGWQWVRIGNLALFTQYGSSEKSNPTEKGVPVLAMGNIQEGRVIWGNDKKIPAKSDELPDLFLKKFDLLYNRTNSAELVGKTGVYLGEDDCRTFASYLIRIRPSLRSSSPYYLNLAMNAPIFRETQIVPLIKQQTGQANVNGTALKNMLIPLPPLGEQHRIVARVDALMALCDQLEASLTTIATTRRTLLDALLHEVLGGQTEAAA